MKTSRVTAANLHVAHGVGGVSLAARRQLIAPRQNVRAFTVSFDDGDVVISKGYIAALKICPDKRLIIPKLPQINEGESGSIDEFGNLRFIAAEFSPDESYDVVAIINADEAKGNFISIRESTDDEEDEEIEDCQRIFKIATFTLTEVGGDLTLEDEHLNQIWESDIIMPWEDLSDDCCSPDDSSSGDDSDEVSISDSSDSDSDGDSEDPSSSSDGGDSCDAPFVDLQARVVTVGDEADFCFNNNVDLENVWIVLNIGIQPYIVCTGTEFGDLTEMILEVRMSGIAGQWEGNHCHPGTYYRRSLWINSISPMPGTEVNINVLSFACAERVFTATVYFRRRYLGASTRWEHTYDSLTLKMPGVELDDSHCSSC